MGKKLVFIDDSVPSVDAQLMQKVEAAAIRDDKDVISVINDYIEKGFSYDCFIDPTLMARLERMANKQGKKLNVVIRGYLMRGLSWDEQTFGLDSSVDVSDDITKEEIATIEEPVESDLHEESDDDTDDEVEVEAVMEDDDEPEVEEKNHYTVDELKRMGL